MGRYLVTGAAGFIGFHTAGKLLGRGDEVFGVDNLNEYYDVRLKHARLERLLDKSGFRFHALDLGDREAMHDMFAAAKPDVVIHLGAQAGVRYSLTNPHIYAHSNLTGFLHVLEECREHEVQHLVYASTSSVYGANTHMPFVEHEGANHPLTLYAATKRANEVMAHSYSHLFGLPATGLRFFTVYGPWGRPDMALFLFTKAILERRPIQLFNGGNMRRDFTYVDDIVEGVVRSADSPAGPDPAWNSDAPDPSTSNAPWRVLNVGNSKPTDLLRYVQVIEECLGLKAEYELLPMQPGDVPATWASVDALDQAVGYRPHTSIETGVRRFVAWYCEFYGVSGLEASEARD